MESDAEARCGALDGGLIGRSRRADAMAAQPKDTAWERLRYGPLLRVASRSRVAGRTFASLVSWVELRRDPERRRVAEERIRRWLGLPAAEAARVYRRAVFSEALEEADAARLMWGAASDRIPVEIRGDVGRAGRPRIYGMLHAGSPVLAFLGMRSCHEPEGRIIARELGENNPMAGAKARFAAEKVAWVEASSGSPFIDTDAGAILEARDHLLAGRPLFAAVDVPGDVVSRADRVDLFGETVVLASGIFRLATMVGADMQLLVSVHRNGRILVDCRPPFDAPDAASLMEAMTGEMEAVLREQPEEFWFWPFFVSPQKGDV